MMTLCPFLCSNETISKHAKSVVFYVASEVLKRLREHLRTFSATFGNSPEIFGSRRDVSGNLGNVTHLTQKKLARSWHVILGRRS